MVSDAGRRGGRADSHAGNGDERRLSAAWYASEIDAQVACSMLKSHGIPATIRFQASAGPPRTIAPDGLQFPGAGYDVLVPATRLDEARQLVGAVHGPRLDRRIVVAFVLVTFLTPLIIAITQLLSSR